MFFTLTFVLMFRMALYRGLNSAANLTGLQKLLFPKEVIEFVENKIEQDYTAIVHWHEIPGKLIQSKHDEALRNYHRENQN